MLKVFEAFAGIGAQRKSLQKLGIPHEVVGISEIDKYAYKSYEAIHGLTKNYGDITKIDTNELPEFDVFTYSFPCTDISIAGKQQGLIDVDGNLTRSGLLYEALRIIKDKRPRYLLAENVKNLVSKKFELDFKRLLNTLEELGYRNYWKVLNAKDYGVPQNRERLFVVSIRKDVQQGFEWPETFDNRLRLKDLLETEVDEKYYINDKRLNIIRENLGDVFRDNFLIGSSQKNAYKGDGSICPSLTSAMGQGGGQTPMVKAVQFNRGEIRIKKDDICSCLDANYHKGLDNHAARTGIITGVYNQNDGFKERELGCTLDASYYKGLGNNQNRNAVVVKVKEATKKGYALAELGDSINIQYPDSNTRRGRVGKQVAQTLETSCSQATLTTDYRIRKLTPLECIRLMNFDDEDYYKIRAAGLSDTQIYKQCGNSIVVACLEAIFKNLLTPTIRMKSDNGIDFEQIKLTI